GRSRQSVACIKNAGQARHLAVETVTVGTLTTFLEAVRAQRRMPAPRSGTTRRPAHFRLLGRQLTGLLCRGPAAGRRVPGSTLQVALPRHIVYGRRYLLDPCHARSLDTKRQEQ